MGDILAQQGEGDRICLQGQHAGAGVATLEIMGGYADVRAGIDDERLTAASLERVLASVEDVMAEALELLAIAAEEPVCPADDDRPSLGGAVADPSGLAARGRRFPGWSGPGVGSSHDRHVAARRVPASRAT